MASRIPQQFIDDLLSRIDIVDIIDARVPLRKAGRDFQARCPFHEEKTPSFTVSQNKQFYHCFGCGAHGTAISFLMEYDHLDFIDTIKELAKQTGMELPQQSTQPQDSQIPALNELMQKATTYYRQQMQTHPDSSKAIDYLKNRGLSEEVVGEFSIGFAPPGWDNLIRWLGNNNEAMAQLVATGMAIRKDDDRCYDRFRNRIMFPIRNRRGKVIGFGGRVLDDEDKPKYLNSPESPLFHKGRELYGLFEARQALRNIDSLIVVEGYMDVVALAQFGVRNAVATLGTAVTTDHMNLLFRTSHDIIFCLDGDRAGREAAWKALDTCLPLIHEGRQVRFMFLPDGEDPDTLIRQKGKQGFEELAGRALPLSSFLLDTLTKEVDLSSLDGRARLVELARPKLKNVGNRIYRLMLIEALAQRIHMNPQMLTQQIEDKSNTHPVPYQARPGRPPQTPANRPSAVRIAITLLLNNPQLAQKAEQPAHYQTLKEPGINILVELLELLHTNPHLHCGGILEHWRDRPDQRHLARLAQQPIETPEEGIEAEFLGALTLLERQLLEQEFQELNRKERETGLSREEKHRLLELLKLKSSLK